MAATALKGLMTNAPAATAHVQQSAYTREQRAPSRTAATPNRRTAAVSRGPAATNAASNQKSVAAYRPAPMITAQHGRMPSSRAPTHRNNNHAIPARDVSAAYATAARSGMFIPGKCHH
eukprot:jgi/Chrzof1/42/Cz01g01120.t1